MIADTKEERVIGERSNPSKRSLREGVGGGCRTFKNEKFQLSATDFNAKEKAVSMSDILWMC